MAHPLTLPPLTDTQVTELRQLYDTTTNANLRLRYQIVLLATQGRSVADIAAIVFRSRDTVEWVLKRFRHGGLPAIPRRKAPGMVPIVTSAWKAELLRVIDLDPPTVGVHSAHWTTGLLASYLAATTHMTVPAETVRLYLRAAGYVGKRPPWTRKRQAEEHPGYVGNASGWRGSWRGLARQPLHP
jgi:transposase